MRAQSSTSAAARSVDSSPARSSAAVRSRRSTSESRRSGSAMVRAIVAHLAQRGAEDAVDEAGSVGTAERLGDLDGLVDGALGRDRALPLDDVGVEHLEQRSAQDGAFERCDAVQGPALRVALDARV